MEQSFGKLNITESSSDGFYCETISFATPFQSGNTIRVFPSLSNEDHPRNANEASVAMLDSVDRNSFSVCLMEPAQPTGEMTLGWFAFSDGVLPSGTLTGSVSFSLFTSSSVCNDVTFSRVSCHSIYALLLGTVFSYTFLFNICFKLNKLRETQMCGISLNLPTLIQHQN